MSQQYDETEKLFSAAVNEFKSGLSDEDSAAFGPCASPGEMVASLDSRIQQEKTKSQGVKLLRSLKLIESFGHAVTPLFDIIGIFVSSHSDLAAMVWGAVRLVFLLGTNFSLFFEKVAEMFQRFAEQLPNYKSQVDSIRKRSEKGEWRPSHVRLLKTLSQVYVDILQFCFEASRIFSKKGSGLLRGAKIALDLSWLSFEDRFKQILARLVQHNLTFYRCVASVLNEEMLKHYDKMDEEALANSESRNRQTEEMKKAERHTMDQTMLNFRRWINPPDWTASFHTALRRRTEDTGTWFLDISAYRAWRGNEVFSKDKSEDTIQQPAVLVLTGKPGYGKTILSATIIEDLFKLAVHPATELTSRLLPGFVGYFHFEKQAMDRCKRIFALRSVLAQVLHAHRRTKAILDILSLAMMDLSTGQLLASESDIVSILKLCLNKLDTSYLVFDAIDECYEWEEFVSFIIDVTTNTRCKILFIARPHLPIKKLCGPSTGHIGLESFRNLEDIRCYLEPHARTLASSFAGGMPAEDIVEAIATRSSSMFLWAKLMVAYLRSPLLTPWERANAINGTKLLEGLPAMFEQILETIKMNLPRNQWVKVHQIFQWVAASKYPLRAEELRRALAVQEKQRASQEEMIPNFESTLLQICCSLVELNSEGTIHFIHLSVLEYLVGTSSHDQSGIDVTSDFAVDLRIAHCYLATTCLLYIHNDVPHGPLSGSKFQSTEAGALQSEFPLLLYAARCWSWHAVQSLQSCHLKPDQSIEKLLLPLFENLRRFASDKSVITTWIEACYVFGMTPSLSDLASKVVIGFGDLRKISQKMNVVLEGLSSCISEVSRNWEQTLLKEPNEVWLPSINAFVGGEFLIGTNEMRMRSLIIPNIDSSILIASQVSSNGKEVGVVRVWPASVINAGSVLFHDCIEVTERSLQLQNTPNMAYSEKHGRNWKVAYEIWSLESLHEIFRVEFFISKNAIPPSFEQDRRHSNFRDFSFSFPVAFSPSLRLAFILSRVLVIHDSAEMDPPYRSEMQILFSSMERWEQNTWEQLRLPCRGKPRRFDHDDLPDLKDSTERDNFEQKIPLSYESLQGNYEWFYAQISADERYIIINETYIKPQFHCTPCVINVYHNVSWMRPSPAPAFKLIASVGTEARGEFKGVICIHPSAAVLAISGHHKPLMWQFTEIDSQLVDVCPYPLYNISFSPCGKYLFGVKPDDYGDQSERPKGTPQIINIEHLLEMPSSQMQALSETNSQNLSLTVGSEIYDASPQATVRKQTPGIAKTSGKVIFHTVDGQTQLSVIGRGIDGDTILRQALHGNGVFVQEAVSRLPKSLAVGATCPIVVESSNPKELRVVLDKEAQKSYYAVRPKAHDALLPAVIDREIGSIPQEVHHIDKGQIPQIESPSASRKRGLEHVLPNIVEPAKTNVDREKLKKAKLGRSNILP